MNKQFKVLTLSTALGGLMATSVTAMANSTVSADARIYSSYGVLGDSNTDSGLSGQAAQTSASLSVGNPVYSSVAPYPAVGTQMAQSSASAYAQEGTLRAHASGNASTAGIVQNAITAREFARANWNDNFIVDGGNALYGTSGYITALLNLNGTFGGNTGFMGPNDYPAMDVVVRLLGTGMTVPIYSEPNVIGTCEGWAYCARLIDDTSLQLSFSNFTPAVALNIPVLFGYGTSLSYTLDIVATASGSTFVGGTGTAADAYADFSHTVLWGGISGVFDANGVPVTAFSLSSTSGFNYAQAAVVPVPAAVWLFGSGLLGLIGVARRKFV